MSGIILGTGILVKMLDEVLAFLKLTLQWE